MIRENDSLIYHSSGRPGKIETHSSKPCITPREMRLAYFPGATFPSKLIAEEPSRIYKYTSKGNLVGVITNGSSVPGMGNVGPEAAKPIQEGISVLLKQLADIDVFDLELNTSDPEKFIDTVLMMEPTFGGINIKDIGVLEGLHIYDRLNECMKIPVFYENLYSSGVAATAALLNALELVDKKIEDARVVICGIGTLGVGCARLFLRLGIQPENLLVYDSKGLLHPDRKDFPEYKKTFARRHAAHTLFEGLKGADVFLGASAPGIINPEMIKTMNSFPILFALATPFPEIDYEKAKASRKDIIVATGMGLYPNAILDILSLPYIFRGALDVQATRITEGMMIAAARSLADLAREDVVEEVERAYCDEHFSFGPEYLLPKPIDPRILVYESSAVAQQAIKEGVARIAIDNESHCERLSVRMGTGRETMRKIIMKAKQANRSIVFSDGTDETILRACSILLDEGIARPTLLGDRDEVLRAIEALDLDLEGITIIDPIKSPRIEFYADEYFRIGQRRGVMRQEAVNRLQEPDYFAALMLHTGDTDMMFAGVSTHYARSFRTILEVIGPAPEISRISSHHMIYFLADCAVNIEPSAEELAEIALLTASRVSSLGIKPRVAMLSFSNFGSVDHPLANKVRRATEIAKKRAPELIIDGEVQLAVAVDDNLRLKNFPFSSLVENANIFIFPDLQSGNLALDLIQQIGKAVSVGPILMGTRLPVHLSQYGVTVEEIVNLVATGAVENVSFNFNNIYMK